MLILRFDRGTLRVEGEGPVPEELTWDPRVKAWRGHAQHYRGLVEGLHGGPAPFKDEAKAWSKLELRHSSERTPRDYQREALAAWRQAGRRGVVSLPTGAGKSFVAELAIAETARPTLVVAPTIDLVVQWRRLLERAFGGPIGALGGGEHELQPITVSTYDSAYIHMERYGDRFGLVVFDEVHHLPAEGYRQVAEMMLAPFRLGLSATVERPDGQHLLLTDLVGPTVYSVGIKDLSGMALADYEVVRVPVELSADEAQAYAEARKVYRDFVSARRIPISSPGGWQRFLQEAARSTAGRAAFRGLRESKRIVQETNSKLEELERILEAHAGQRVIVFTNDNATVYRISRGFGVPCITHETGAEERKTILANFESGRWPVVVTSRVLNEGVDLPAAEVGVVLSGTSTVREHVQRLGRILRPQPGKLATLYELVTVGTTEELASDRRNDHDAYR